jgi:4-carboxymuconolactone decarboxylase
MAFVDAYPAVFDTFLAEVDDQTTGHLDERTRHIVRLAAPIAYDATNAYPSLLASALDTGPLDPADAGEVVVQAVPYVGMGRAATFARLTSDVLAARGAQLPLASQTTVTAVTATEAGLAVQRQIVGAETVDALYADAAKDQLHIQRWLSAHCFGDHYTRSGRDVPARELVTFILLSALGGADPQVAAHVTGNLNVGNDRATMTDAITAVLPWIGYPAASTRCAPTTKQPPARPTTDAQQAASADQRIGEPLAGVVPHSYCRRWVGIEQGSRWGQPAQQSVGRVRWRSVERSRLQIHGSGSTLKRYGRRPRTGDRVQRRWPAHGSVSRRAGLIPSQPLVTMRQSSNGPAKQGQVGWLTGIGSSSRSSPSGVYRRSAPPSQSAIQTQPSESTTNPSGTPSLVSSLARSARRTPTVPLYWLYS